jgi:hypothetical protein
MVPVKQANLCNIERTANSQTNKENECKGPVQSAVVECVKDGEKNES